MKISEYLYNVFLPKADWWMERNIHTIMYTDEELELLPCPVCNRESTLKIYDVPDGHVSYIDAHIECTKCGIRTKAYTVNGYYGDKHTLNDVLNSWNVRSNTQ